MNKISFIKSLMEFNKRVLSQGIPDTNVAYTLSELKDLLFFNKVFVSNTDEMFERHKVGSVISEYINALNMMVKNINIIIQSMVTNNRGIAFTREDSFERRFAMRSQVADRVITKYYKATEPIAYSFESGKIYYFGIFKNGLISVSYVDMERSVYYDPMGCKFKNGTLYWKTDDCIRDFIKEDLQAVAVVAAKVTVSAKDPDIITKIEYNGDTETMKNISPLFGKQALIISNPFIYLGDIDHIIENNITETKPQEIQKIKLIDALDLLEEDVLMEYPTDSFNDYLQFLRSVVTNPETSEIYLTLYRVGSDPSIFYILREAVQKGIKVHVNIELYASGETVNKIWKREMEELGIDVTTYALGRLKVHAKLTLVKFNNGRSVAQIGTGNYHTKTTTQYTDLSLMTSDDEICHQIEKVFDMFDDGDDGLIFNNDLLVTRFNARQRLIDLIDEQADKEEDGYICIKCNALDDDEIIRHLDKAAASGCKMDLIVRGVCTWVPEELGSSINIKSIVWDKLEHSRVYAFGRKNPTIYMGSLDLVTNKLDKRIETLVRINNPKILIQVCDYLNRYITNTKGTWIMTPGGKYVKE